MGTNYYAIRKVSEESKSEMKQAIDKNDFVKVHALLPNKIHIGKKSPGWVFLFNHNNWEYYGERLNGLDCIQSFLKSCQIGDEYGYSLSYEEFWAIVEGSKDLKNERQYGCIYDGLNYSNHTDFS